MRHRGHQKAVVAVAHALLVTVHGLARQTVAMRSVSRAVPSPPLERQGYRVTIERVA
jgi:hypothetical protein